MSYNAYDLKHLGGSMGDFSRVLGEFLFELFRLVVGIIVLPFALALVLFVYVLFTILDHLPLVVAVVFCAWLLKQLHIL